MPRRDLALLTPPVEAGGSLLAQFITLAAAVLVSGMLAIGFWIRDEIERW